MGWGICGAGLWGGCGAGLWGEWAGEVVGQGWGGTRGESGVEGVVGQDLARGD